MVNAIQYTIKYQSVTHTHCVVSLWTHPPRIPRTTLRGVNVSMIMNNYIHTWFIWLAGQLWQLIQLMWTNMTNKLKYEIINN